MKRIASSFRRLRPYSLNKQKVLASKGRFKMKQVRITPYSTDVFNLVNQERASRGIAQVSVLYRVITIGTRTVRVNYLGRIATIKAADMRNNNYFSHTSPTYGTPGEMLIRFGVDWTAYGENIAAGQRTPQEVMNAWMDSPGHRENILNPDFTYLGVGYVPGNTESDYATYWVQLFVRL